MERGTSLGEGAPLWERGTTLGEGAPLWKRGTTLGEGASLRIRDAIPGKRNTGGADLSAGVNDLL